MLVSLRLRIWLGKGEETVLDDWAPLRQIDFAISLKLFRTRVPTPTPRTPHRRNSHRTNAKRPVTGRPASAESGRQPDRPPEQDRKRIYAEAASKKGPTEQMTLQGWRLIGSQTFPTSMPIRENSTIRFIALSCGP
jgi:hypothetical protein